MHVNIKNPQDIMKVMGQIKYGFKTKQGEIINQESSHWDDQTYFYKNYKLQSPEELLQSKYGVCWDQCELQRVLFDEYLKLDFTVYYTECDNADKESHSLLVYEYDNKYYWFEHSWNEYEGIHQYDSIKSLFEEVSKYIKKNAKSLTKSVNWYSFHKPEYGISVMSFMKMAKLKRKISIVTFL